MIFSLTEARLKRYRENRKKNIQNETRFLLSGGTRRRNKWRFGDP
jgi:hypothetical protein